MFTTTLPKEEIYLLNFNGASKPSSNAENEILSKKKKKKILPALSKR